MAESNSMKILDFFKVFPSDSPFQFSLPLTFFDRIWLETKPISRLFFYELPEPKSDFINAILPKLKQSLSLTLQYFLPLAGNLTWPQASDLPIIQYRAGDGVCLTVAESQASFDYLSGDGFRKSAELRTLLPSFSSSETLAPAMTLQITLFPGRGFCIAYVAHHAIMDGKATSMFMHSWAYICKKGDVSVLPPELTPSLDRTFVKHHLELEKVYPKGFGPVDLESKILTTFDMTPPDTMLGTFRLTRENIEALKHEVKTTGRISTFTITTAYIAICLIKAKKVAADVTYFGFSVDCRLRLNPPLPSTYFGNCILVSGGGHDTKDFLEENGFATAVSAVGEALATLDEGIVKVVEKISCGIKSSVQKSFAGFTVGGSPRFELYKVDFGWGKPVKVEMISIDHGTGFYLSDHRDDNGGIEIGIAFKKHETEAFASAFANGLEGH